MMTFTPALIDEMHPLEIKGELSAEVLGLNPVSARAEQAVQVELTVIKEEEGNYLASGWAVVPVSLVCGRCADWFPEKLRAKVEHLFEAPLPNSIDLTPFIREDILLELPLNAVCRLGADGRCPITGEFYQPRPETSGSIVSEEVWEALSKLKTKD
jgi:uncharacterized metal-binding protein YceD (DUF177 family)